MRRRRIMKHHCMLTKPRPSSSFSLFRACSVVKSRCFVLKTNCQGNFPRKNEHDIIIDSIVELPSEKNGSTIGGNRNYPRLTGGLSWVQGISHHMSQG